MSSFKYVLTICTLLIITTCLVVYAVCVENVCKMQTIEKEIIDKYNVTGIEERIEKYIKSRVMNCSKCHYRIRNSTLEVEEELYINESRFECIKSRVKCRECIINASIINASESILEWVEAHIKNSTIHCRKCSIVGKIVLEENATLILENANLTLAEIVCNKCRGIISKFKSKYINVTMNHTKAWLRIGKENPYYHNVTISVSVESPGTTVSVEIVTKYCIDNLTTIKTGNASFINFMTCRPRINITVTTKVLNLTIYHGIYSHEHDILVHTDAEAILNYTFHPRPDIILNVTVDNPHGTCSVNVFENITTKPYRVLVNNTDYTLLESPHINCTCPCWVYANNTVIVKALHASPLTISLLTVAPAPIPTWIYALIAIITTALIIIVIMKIRERRKKVSIVLKTLAF